MAGLILQIIVIVAFIAAFSDYMFRFWRSGRISGFGWRLQAFFAGLSSATILILVRCAYRVAELKDGYSGDLITHEVPFIVLEGVVIVLAATSLFWGHPGLALEPSKHNRNGKVSDTESGNVSGIHTPEPKPSPVASP
jgi:hypothetical protein